jgi:sirohydrochlorin ferrochelatase
MTGFLVFAHGSRIESANEAVRTVAGQLATAGGHIVEPAFLELGQPDLTGAVDRLAAHGVDRVVVLPYFLTLGTHMQRDLPVLVAEAARKHGNLEISVAAPLDGHPALVQVLLDRAQSATPSEIAK